MSGGVDSSVTAYLLKEKGYEVEGISFLMWESVKADAPACCSLRATEETSETARHIDIPHRIIDVREDFKEKVVKPFVQAYLSGLTPNPCILCNRFIKFPKLLEEAEKSKAAYISTGHYARVERSQDTGCRIQDAGKKEKFVLKKGVEPKKDQSYVLYVLTQDILKKLILPLGYYRKNDVRKMAKELRFPAAERSESQEICFIEGKNYLAFIKNFATIRGKPGAIIDLQGNIIGTHKGIYGYTIGQRKRLGISSPAPLYAVDIDIRNNTVLVGPAEAAKKKEFFVGDLNLVTPLFPPLLRGDREVLQKEETQGICSFRASVKVRSMMKDAPATIFLMARSRIDDTRMKSGKPVSCILDPASIESVRVVFDEPQWAPAPGQSAVFYDGDAVIGGGIIRKPG